MGKLNKVGRVLRPWMAIAASGAALVYYVGMMIGAWPG